MLDTVFLYILMVLAILFLVMIAIRLKIAYPIVLVVGGLLLSMLSWVPSITINPQLIFVIFLPPLLYEAGWYTSWKDFWRWKRVIFSFAFLIVIVTSFVIALVSSAILPGFTLALGFLLGGIVSPPDAVSATSIMKTVNVPKRLSSIIEGESLLNDASSLIIFRFALIAVDTGKFILHEAALNFVLVIAVGIICGVVIGMIYYAIHRWLPTTTNIDTILTLTAPYVMYIVAEHFGASGVLSVVCGSLFLTVRSHEFLSNRSRFMGGNVWSALSFLLNGIVFMLIGLQLPVIVNELGGIGVWRALGYGALITLVLIVTRMICTFGTVAFTLWIKRFITVADENPGWKVPIIFGWAGMRGVVSLAAALSIPIYMTNGQAFPQRSLILFITFTVILLTLVIQGLTLPWVIRKVNMEDPDKKLTTEEEHQMIRRKMAKASLKYLDENYADVIRSNPAIHDLRARFDRDQVNQDEAVAEEQQQHRQIYLEVIGQQRLVLMELNKRLEADEELIRKYETMLDLEEEKMRIKFDRT